MTPGELNIHHTTTWLSGIHAQTTGPNTVYITVIILVYNRTCYACEALTKHRIAVESGIRETMNAAFNVLLSIAIGLRS